MKLLLPYYCQAAILISFHHQQNWFFSLKSIFGHLKSRLAHLVYVWRLTSNRDSFKMKRHNAKGR